MHSPSTSDSTPLPLPLLPSPHSSPSSLTKRVHPSNTPLPTHIEYSHPCTVHYTPAFSQGNHVVLANAKLALFYDWLAYNPELDNIMNIGQCQQSVLACIYVRKIFFCMHTCTCIHVLYTCTCALYVKNLSVVGQTSHKPQSLDSTV